MPQLIGVARLGKDAELRYTPQDNQPVINLALAFNYGRKDPQTNNRPTQWVDASLWGERAEKLAPFLLKGQPLYVVVDDVHTELFEGRNGPGVKLVGRIAVLDFAGPNPNADGQGQQRQAQRPQAPAPAPRQQHRPAPAPQSRGPSGFDDLDDDIPF